MEEKASFIDCCLSKDKIKYELMVKYVGDIFSKIDSQGFFKEYPDHGADHSKKIIENIDRLLLFKSEDLNDLESMILLFSIFYHDIGMVLSAKEVWDFKNDSFEMNSNYQFVKLSKFIKDDRSIRPSADSDVSLMENYIRKNHHLISANKIIHDWQNLSICSNNKYCDNCKQIVADLSASHGWENDRIEKLSASIPVDCPLIKDTKNINVQFLSILLRLGDLLDFTNGRVPMYLYDFINPNNLKSIIEWKKQQAVKGINLDTTDPEILNIYGHVNDIDIYFCLMDFLDYVSQNLDESRKVLYNNEKKIKPKKTNKDAIITDGFEKIKLQYKTELESILSLLSKELYKGESSLKVVTRELLQNSLDACRFRRSQDLEYAPKIIIEYDAKNRTLSIADNGKGMDMEEVSNCLLRIGKSFYKNHAITGFIPYSQFGIGFLSCYLIASKIAVKTKRYEKSSNNESIHLSIRSIQDYVIKMNHNAIFDPGTIITLNLKEELSESITKILDDLISHIDIPIEIIENNTKRFTDAEVYPYDRTKKIENLISESREFYDGKKRDQFISLQKIKINSKDVKGYLYYLQTFDNPMKKTRFFESDLEKSFFVFFHNLGNTNTLALNGMVINSKINQFSNWFNLHPRESCFFHDLNFINVPFQVSLDRKHCIPEQGEKLHDVKKTIDNAISSEMRKVIKSIDSNSSYDFTHNLLDIIQFNEKILESNDKNFIRLIDDLLVIRFGEQIQKFKNLKTKKEFLYICTLGSDFYRDYYSSSRFPFEKWNKKILDLYSEKIAQVNLEFYDFLFFDRIESYFLSYFRPEQVVIDSEKEYSGLLFAKYKPKASSDLMKINNGYVVPFFLNGTQDTGILATLVGKYALFNSNHPLIKYCIEKELCEDMREKFLHQLNHGLPPVFLLNNTRFKSFRKDVNAFCHESSLPEDAFQISEKSFVKWDYEEYWKALIKQKKRKSKQNTPGVPHGII
jgi:hypothetical protein